MDMTTCSGGEVSSIPTRTAAKKIISFVQPFDCTIMSTVQPNLWVALNAVRDWWGDLGLCEYLRVPVSVKHEILRQTSDDTEQKKTLLERWLRDYPAPSWAVVAEALYKMGEHDILEQVKKMYITGTLT